MNPHDALSMQRALAEGHSVVVRGELPMALPMPPGWAVLRVRCEEGARPLAPLREAAARALQWIGEEHAIDSIGVMRVGDGAKPEALARAINRLAAKTPTGCALLFDQVDRADHETLALLRRWLSMAGSLRMPVVLAFGDAALAGEARALFDTARELGAVEVAA
ncbi:MAG: putative LuxR-family transcriptional regulator, partial [Myxococcaceae bacterium]|nr:putative LuxR-family transcriptional regulator [Myxococcaceae bacterium]